MTDASTAAPRFSYDLLRWFSGRSKTALAFAALICFSIFWFLGYIANVPADRGFNSSLLAGASPVVALIITAIGLVGCTLLMSVLQSHAEVEDPLFPVCIGLIALSCRGGTMTSLLQMSSLNVYWLLIIELVLLFAMILGCWRLLIYLRRRRPGVALMTDPADLNERLLCALVTVLITGICMYLFGQTDDKKQVLAAVGISAFVGAAAAYAIFDIHVSACYAIAPLVIGVFGYLTALFLPGDWKTGRIGQPLAYPLPLDYAGIGVAGALLGYWTSQKWKEEGQG